MTTTHSYTVQTISPLQLKLDIKNPRFLATQPTQENSILYLLTYAKVRDLALDIIRIGGLFPGERIVVFKDSNDDYIVLEGNRRVCACQILLDRSRIPAPQAISFPEATDTVRDAIRNLNIDVISSREAAAAFLASRHIGGVERWDTLAKMKFFEEKFTAGQSIDQISALTNHPAGDIKNHITQYYLFFEAYSLPCWTQTQKDNELNLFKIEVDKFVRIFNTKGAKTSFKLTFDQTTLKSVSALPRNIFENVLTQIMYCAFITTDPNEKIDTRTKSWRNVPGIEDLINQANPPATTTPQPTVQPSLQSQQNPQPSRPSTRISSQTTNSSTISTNTTQSVTSSAGNNRGSYQSASRTSSSLNNTQNQSSLISFFESLTWSGVDPSLPQNQGLLAIADEIKRISTGQRPIYRQIPVAATTLLRSLLEQTLKYHLRKKDPQALSGMSQRYDPSLNSLLKHYTDNQKYCGVPR